MMHRLLSALAVAALVTASFAGCGSDRAATLGGPQLVFEGRPVSELVVDFGKVILDSEVSRTLVIRNNGRGPFAITGITGSADLSPEFAFTRIGSRVEVGPDEQFTVTLSFRPTVAGSASGSIHIALANAALPELVIGVAGQGVASECELSAQDVDFGAADVNSSSTMQLHVFNHSGVAWRAVVHALETEGASAAFAFGAGFTPGDYLVPAADLNGTPGELVIPLDFEPTAVGEFRGQLAVDAPSCPSTVTLHGVGVLHVLECRPLMQSGDLQVCGVDFGYVDPGATAVKPVRFRNLGGYDINLTLVSVSQPSQGGAPFRIEDAERTFVIPRGGSEISIDLAFAPAELGEQTGKLNWGTDYPGAPSGYVELRGVGGGPAASVSPDHLDFRKAAVDAYQVRTVTITNVGTPVAGTTDDNLLLAAQDGSDAWVEKRPELSGPGASEFAVEWPPIDYVSGVGLQVDQSASLRIKFAPHSEGNKAATLTLFTNDVAKPRIEIPLTGFAETQHPCDIEVKPASLDFGTVETNRSLTLNLAIVNRDADYSCHVALVDLTANTASAGAFALANGPEEELIVGSGETALVPVRFAPKADGSYHGQIEFFVPNPTAPEVHVDLTGIAQPTCLMIAPREDDFGAIAIGCRSRQRAFTLYNTCSSPLELNSIAMQPGASTEFSITKWSGQLPFTLASNASYDFSVTYAPIDDGRDAASVAIAVSGNTITYVVAMTGNGTSYPVQTDVFAPATRPMVDVLFIVDLTASMLDKQASLASNFGSFLQFATTNNVDYRIAVTAAAIAEGAQTDAGKFLPLTGTDPRVITPTTPNKEQVFRQKIQVGTNDGNESIIRPAFLALTNPLINSHNTGFYRDDAKLAIVTVSDAADQDPQNTPITFYENFFFNLKGVSRRRDFSFSGIIPTLAQEPPYSSGCSYDSSDAGLDTRVKQLIQRTGGVQGEICNSSWSQALAELGGRVFGPGTTFYLSNVPDLTADAITVRVDGQIYPQYGANNVKRWDYVATSNAIEFDPLALPDAGSSISISYWVACVR